MITTNNYFRDIQTVSINTLPETLKKNHEFLVKVTVGGASWASYKNSEQIHKTIDAYLVKLNEWIKTQKPHSPVKGESKKPAKIPVAKKVKATKPPVIKLKKETSKKFSGKIHKVEHLIEEIKFIKRYVGLHNKVKTPSAILNFIKAVQKAIVQKIIAKTSSFAEEIRLIQDKLVKTYNNLKGNASVSIEINETDLARMVGIAGGEEVYASIPIIKRYIGMEGKMVEPAKINAFVSHIENVIKKEALKSDPYADKVKKILATLKRNLKGKREAINVSETELNGLSKIVKHCDKHYHKHHVGNYTKHHSHRHSSHSHHSLHGLGVLTAEEVVNQHFDLLPFSGQWQALVGQPARNFTMMLHGEPGSGKTTFMLKFVKYLSSMGSVLYVSSEEFNSSTLKAKVLEYLTPLPQNVHFAMDTHSSDLSQYDFVILDSINDIGLNLEDFKAMKRAHPNTAFVLLLQHTKAGQFRGGKEWEHEAAIAGVVNEGIISIYKNRFGVKGTMNFFN